MKHFKSILFSMSVLMIGYSAQAQKLTLTKGGQTANDQEKGTDPLNFISNGDHYFIIKYFAKAIMAVVPEASSSAPLAMVSVRSPLMIPKWS